MNDKEYLEKLEARISELEKVVFKKKRHYVNLIKEMKNRNITYSQLYHAGRKAGVITGKYYSSLQNRIKGIVDNEFNFEEARFIRDYVDPTLSFEYLFKREEV